MVLEMVAHDISHIPQCFFLFDLYFIKRHLPLTRSLAEGLGVRVPNVSVSHDNVLRTKKKKRERLKKVLRYT
jgi:hypothetical protein